METLLLILFISITTALHCDKIFNYYDNYGNGFDITCEGITQEYINLLQNITISQEISLTIDNSTLKNLDSKLFERIQHLKYLYIYNSVFTFQKNATIFKFLNNLEHLEIKNTTFNVYKNTFRGLDMCKDLIMENNSLSSIEAGSFQHLSSIKRLELTSNKIKNVKGLPLCEIQDLETLNLSKNSLASLQVSDFLCKNLVNIVNKNNKKEKSNTTSTSLPSSPPSILRVTHIDLSYNRIATLGDSLSHLRFLRKLKLHQNALTVLNHYDFSELNDLQEIYLQNNDLSIVEDNVFKGKTDLQYIDLSHNKLTRLNIGELPLLDYLDLGYNALTNLTINSISTMKSLRFLFLNNNNFSRFRSHAFEWFKSLETLDLSDNAVVFHEQSLNGLIMLKTLNLRNNSIKELNANLFNSLTHLKTLDLSHNKIQSLTFNKTFQYLRDLEVLNLSYNALQELDYDIVEPLESLRILDISGNNLKNIQYELILSNLKLLSVLDIKSNLLSCEMLYNIIKYLKKKDVTYTLVNKLDYERENVAGIYCSSEKASLTIVNVSSKNSVLVNIAIVVSIIFALVIICIVIFRIHIYLRRRKYRPDEFELINE